MTSAHSRQRTAWDTEHANPHVLPAVDSSRPARGVVEFWSFLKERQSNMRLGVEFGCGKGRNVIWLAQQGLSMHGIDFSYIAIEEAKRRASQATVATTTFYNADAIERWPYPDASFDIAIDCFASSDIEAPTGRSYAVSECSRVLKSGGHAPGYFLSTQDEYFLANYGLAPAEEAYAFYHPTSGKFEKSFTIAEILVLYRAFRLVAVKRFASSFEAEGVRYSSAHWWCIFRKP